MEYFPGGTVYKNPPTDAGDMGSIPGPGRFHMRHSDRAHAVQPVSYHLSDPMCCNYGSPHAPSLCSATREATIMRSPRTTAKSSPHSPQLEKSHAQHERSTQQQQKCPIKFLRENAQQVTKCTRVKCLRPRTRLELEP